MAVASDPFTKCLPVITNNIDECGAVTACSVITTESDELTSIFTDGSGNFRDLRPLLATQFEIKACGAKQNGLYDFLMSNKRMMNKSLGSRPLGQSNLAEIDPFVMAYQRSVINSEYWRVLNLFNSAGTYTIHVAPTTNSGVPLDVRWFVPGMNVYVFARTGAGTALRGSFLVVSAASGSFGGTSTIQITATAENNTLGSSAKAAFSGFTSGSPLSQAFLIRGSANVADVERWCFNRPALNDRKHVPFWWETDRYTMCTDSQYENWFNMLSKGNEYFRLFGNVDAAERNKQLGMMHQREWVNKFFWNKPISSNQTLAAYRSLTEITSFGQTTQGLYVPGEGRCVGRKANAIGIYEQLAECGRIYDLQNQTLNLVELFEQVLYGIWRARGDQGIPNQIIEVFTDSLTAQQIQRGMIAYYNDRSAGLARFMIDTKQVMSGQMGMLGFNYDEYRLQYPVTTLRVVTHPFFDDMVSAANDAGVASTGRMLWILDFTGIYPGIIASNRKVHRTGDIEELAKVDRDYACVMANPTQEISLNSITWTAVLECPANNAIVENFNANVPIGTGAQYPYSDLYSV